MESLKNWTIKNGIIWHICEKASEWHCAHKHIDLKIKRLEEGERCCNCNKKVPQEILDVKLLNNVK